nr:pollen-specific leucine-rich repeat extensin-like protein 1 isoform X2 [Setaria viridis]
MVSSFARSLRALRTWDGNRFSGASGSGAGNPDQDALGLPPPQPHHQPHRLTLHTAAPVVLGLPPPQPHHQPPPPVGAGVQQLQNQPAVAIRPVGQLGEAPGGYAALLGHPVRPAAPAVLGIPPPRPHHQPPPPVGASVLQLQKQPAVGIRPVGQLGEAPGGYAAQFGHPVPPADQPGPDPTPTPTTRTSSARPAGTIRCRRRINHGGISACATPAEISLDSLFLHKSSSAEFTLSLMGSLNITFSLMVLSAFQSRLSRNHIFQILV